MSTRGESFQQRLDRERVTTGFEYLRLGLALAILCVHSVAVSYGRVIERIWIWGSVLEGPVRLILPMFFALSGFLVAGSIFRVKTISAFVSLRALRIVPALAVEVVLSALVLGPIFTTLTLSEYFHDPLFFNYFRNIAGDIQFKLPQVFETNPFNLAVNVSLWTVPYELECYIALTIFMIFGVVKSRTLVALATVAAGFFLFYSSVRAGGFNFTHDGAVEPRAMVVAFFGGVTLYLYRDRVRLNGLLFAAAIAVATALHYSRETAYLAAMPVAYATVYLGLLMPKKLPYIFSGDYSYGIYLYAFPVQQSVAFLLPDHRFWWLNILLAIPVTALFAVASWHGLEKHVMALKGRVAGPTAFLPRLENWSKQSVRRLGSKTLGSLLRAKP